VIECWHIIAILVGAVCNVVLLFMYIKWFRKARLSKPQDTVKQLSTFYKALAVVCFLPLVSPAYWISSSSLFWDIVRPFLPPLYHLAGLAMMVVFFFCFSLVFFVLCFVAASWLPSGSGKKVGLFVSALFILTSVSSLWSLYKSLILAFGDPYYYWASYLLYMLANVSIAITNTLSIYCLVATEHVDVG